MSDWTALLETIERTEPHDEQCSESNEIVHATDGYAFGPCDCSRPGRVRARIAQMIQAALDAMEGFVANGPGGFLYANDDAQRAGRTKAIDAALAAGQRVAETGSGS